MYIDKKLLKGIKIPLTCKTVFSLRYTDRIFYVNGDGTQGVAKMRQMDRELICWTDK